MATLPPPLPRQSAVAGTIPLADRPWHAGQHQQPTAFLPIEDRRLCESSVWFSPIDEVPPIEIQSRPDWFGKFPAESKWKSGRLYVMTGGLPRLTTVCRGT